jgi:ABC-type polysaccharide/polyol phosphate transport system ATPase subunit
LADKWVHALSDLSITIREGERVGLVGTNGSGKTTLLKVLADILYPTAGSVEVAGKVNAIFDPALGMDPEASGLENILIRCMLLGIPTRGMDQKVEQIADFSELGEALRRPLKSYSSGMAMRLAFAVATSIEPEILVMDEWLSAVDARFVSKAFKKMESLMISSRILVIASHSEHVLTEWCSRLLWMQSGKVILDGKPKEVWEEYRRYTDEPERAREFGALVTRQGNR